MSQPHKNAFGLELLLRVTICWKKKKNQSYNQVSFVISVDTKRTVECAAILIRILCGTFCLYHDKMFSLTFSRYNIFPYSKNKKKKQ